jgi:hypothetical protein
LLQLTFSHQARLLLRHLSKGVGLQKPMMVKKAVRRKKVSKTQKSQNTR